MAGPELHFLTIAEASRRIAQRELSPVELTETYLQRIAAVTAEEVRDAAQRYLTTERCWLGIMRGGAATVE